MKKSLLIILLISSVAYANNNLSIQILHQPQKALIFEDYKYVIDFLKTNKSLFNNSIEYKTLLGAVNTQLLLDDKAIEIFKKIPESKLSNFAITFYSTSLRRAGKYDQALRLLNLDKSNTNVQIYHSKILIYIDQKKYEKALELIKKTIEINKPEAWLCNLYLYTNNKYLNKIDDYCLKCLNSFKEINNPHLYELKLYSHLVNNNKKSAELYLKKLINASHSLYLAYYYKNIVESGKSNIENLILNPPISYILRADKIEFYEKELDKLVDTLFATARLKLANKKADNIIDDIQLILTILSRNKLALNSNKYNSYKSQALKCLILAKKDYSLAKRIFNKIKDYPAKDSYEANLQKRLNIIFKDCKSSISPIDLNNDIADNDIYNSIYCNYKNIISENESLKHKIHTILSAKLKNSFNPDIALLYTALRLREGKPIEPLISIMEKAITHPEKRMEYYQLLIILYTYNKDYDKALKLINYYEKEISSATVFRYLYKRVMEKSGRAWWVDK